MYLSPFLGATPGTEYDLVAPREVS